MNTLAEMYREAAHTVFMHGDMFSCVAIHYAFKNSTGKLAASDSFVATGFHWTYFGPKYGEYEEHPFWNKLTWNQEVKDCRILALLFLAEMAETGDL